MSGHESAPYQLLVDHLAAAASENKEIFANISSIQCPAKPTDYTCPQVLSMEKEELKKKLCDYETILTGVMSLVPDSQKATTHCGAFNILKQDAKNADEVAQLSERIALVLGKDCQLKSVLEQQQNENNPVFILVKTGVPTGTKFIVADGSNIDLLSSQSIDKDELSSLMQQCPKKSQ